MEMNNSPQDNLNLNLLNETLECLNKTFKEKNNAERKKAERRLQELEENILLHIKTILTALNSPNLNQELKLSIILYLKNILRSRIENKSFNKEEVMEIIKTFIELILIGNLNDQLLQNLNLGLTYLLNSNYITQDNLLIPNVCQFLHNHLIKIEGEKYLNFKPVILLQQTIISSKSSNSENIFDVTGKMLESINFMIQALTDKMRSFTIEEDVIVYLKCTETIRCILDFFFLILLKLKKLDSLDKIIPIFINQFLNFTVDTLSLANQVENNLISFRLNKEVDSNLNSMKAKALQVLSFIVQNEGMTIKNNTLVEFLSKIVNSVISTLNSFIGENEKFYYISEMSKDNEAYPDYNYDSVIFQMMLFLSRFLAREPIVTQFTPFVKNFTLSVIFPLLMTTKADTILMKVDGEEYHSNTIDTIESHKNKNFKTATSFLLLKLCDKFDGLNSFLINFCLQLIDYNLNGSDPNNLPNYTILNSININSTQNNYTATIKNILTNLNVEMQMDISLLIVLILKNQLIKSSHFLAILRLIIETHANKIFTIKSEIIKDKLCLIFGIFLDEIYAEDEIEKFNKLFTNIFEFLFIQILDYMNNPGLAYSSSYALNQLIYYKGYVDITNNIVRKLMPKLIDNIKEIEVILFFDVLVDIVLYLDIEDYVLSLSREIVNRILKEIKSSRITKEKELNVFVNKSFHILRTILEKNKMFNLEENRENKNMMIQINPDNLLDINDFENIIEPIVNYIKNPNKIDFDDEIIYLMTNVIQNAKKITNLAKKIFQYYPAYLIKNDGLTEDLFELLNLYVIYDKDENFLIQKENVVTLLKIIKSSIEESEEYTLSPILASLLAQNWIQSNQNISENIIVEIINFNLKEIEETFNLYKDTLDELGNTYEVFNFTNYLTTVYSGFINYSFVILSKLNEMQIFYDFIEWTNLFLHFKYFSTYQSKIVILGICSILSNQNFTNNIDPTILNKFFSIIFLLLNKQKDEETHNLKSAMKKELECNFINSDDEEEYDEDNESEEGTVNYSQFKKFNKKIQQLQGNNNGNNYSNKEEQQIKKLINKMKAPIKEIDEYDIFNRTLQNINCYNKNLIDNWLSKLDEVHLNLWIELIHTRRIKVEYSGNKMDVPRRTVRIKRSQNN